ncbi:hypothetical protein [Shimia sp.]|uniref:hypothetical protein n=1 Tax=Shimia sp. TaxID=1954381 RepID=UPI003B8B6F46
MDLRVILRCVTTLVAVVLSPGSVASAQGKATTLRVAAEVNDTGVVKYMMPRFTLKHGVRVTIVAEGEAAAAQLGPEGDTPVFSRNGVTFGLTVENVDDPHMATFAKWLTGEVGQRTVLSFKQDGEAVFELPIAAETIEDSVELDGDAKRGADLALQACGRCHVVGEVNRMAGIGSTPSFAVLRSMEDWMERFTAFYALNPHPAFTVIPDVTMPFDDTRPSPISPLTLTLEELENIVAYTATVAPADLGAPIAHQ